jgi:hypothetical protein
MNSSRRKNKQAKLIRMRAADLAELSAKVSIASGQSPNAGAGASGCRRSLPQAGKRADEPAGGGVMAAPAAAVSNAQIYSFRKAVKHNAKLRLAVAGPGGSGKTYALLPRPNSAAKSPGRHRARVGGEARRRSPSTCWNSSYDPESPSHRRPAWLFSDHRLALPLEQHGRVQVERITARTRSIVVGWRSYPEACA